MGNGTEHSGTTTTIRRLDMEGVSDVLSELCETTGIPKQTREDYLHAVLGTFAYRVAERAAHPGAMEVMPDSIGLYAAVEPPIFDWARRCAAELDELITATYATVGERR